MSTSPRENAAALRTRALRYLARREHSRAELVRKLAPHAESPEALDSVVCLLLSQQYLSDERFADERARSLFRKFGAAKVRQDLKAKGVADHIVERISAEGELERAQAILARKYRAPASTREERAKRARFLQSRGFSFDTIYRLVRIEAGE